MLCQFDSLQEGSLPSKRCSTCQEDIVLIRVLGDFPWGERKTPRGNVNYTPKEYTVHQIWVPPMGYIIHPLCIGMFSITKTNECVIHYNQCTQLIFYWFTFSWWRLYTYHWDSGNLFFCQWSICEHQHIKWCSGRAPRDIWCEAECIWPVCQSDTEYWSNCCNQWWHR